MKAGNRIRLVIIALVAALAAFTGPAFAQDKPSDNMEILREKMKADKKLLVALNMELTDSEAQGFWPIYEDYQKDLEAINRRLVDLLKSYAADFRNKTLTDERARELLDQAIAVEGAEVKLKESYVPTLSKVLPAKKVARYIQIENKLRAIVKYDLAGLVPLVQ